MRGSISLLTVFGLMILGITGCGSGDSKRSSSRHSYNFKVSGCPTSHIKGRYNNFEDMCRALMLETQMNPCAANEIYRTFEAKNCHRKDIFLQQNPLQTNGQMLNPGGFIDHSSGQDILATPHGNIILEDTPDYIELDPELAYEDQIISSKIENYYVDLKNKKALIDGHLEIDLSVLDDDGRGIYVSEDSRPRPRPERVVIDQPREKAPTQSVEDTRPRNTEEVRRVEEEAVSNADTITAVPEARPRTTKTEEDVKPATPAADITKDKTPPAEDTTPAQTVAPTGFNLVSFKQNGILYSEVPSPSSQSRLPILKITSTLDSRSPLYNKKHLDATTALATEIVEPASNGCEVLSYISTSKEVLVLSLQVKDKNNEAQIAACKTWFKSITATGFKILTPKLNTDKGSQISGEFEFVKRD